MENEEDIYVIPLSYSYKEGFAGGVRIERSIFEDMMRYMAAEKNFKEKGCILGAEKGIVTSIYPDVRAYTTRNSYHPSGAVSKVIKIWHSCGINFVGLVHSHKRSLMLSEGDHAFVRRLFALNPRMERFFLGVIMEGRFVLYRFDPDFVDFKEEK